MCKVVICSSYFNEIIELCVHVFYCDVLIVISCYRHLFLLLHLEMSFLTRLLFLCPFIDKYECVVYVSTLKFLYTGDFGFMFKFSYDGHILVGTKVS